MIFLDIVLYKRTVYVSEYTFISYFHCILPPGNRMLAEAEVMTLSYLSEPSARFLWDSYINSSTHSSLTKLSKLQKDELFKSVHGICAGNIADMLRMKFALECSPNFERAKADLVANAATTRLSAFQLYDQSFESLSDEDRNKLRYNLSKHSLCSITVIIYFN